MGAALVIPTKDVKMLIPSTAASLHRAFRKPKAVVLFRGPPVQHGGPGKVGNKERGMGGFVGEGRVWGSEREMAGGVGEGRKDRSQRGEGCTSGNVDKLGGQGERRPKD